MSTKDLRKALRRFVEVIADEAEHNRAFAEKLRGFLLTAPDQSSEKVDFGQDLPGDPFEIYQTGAEQGLRTWLETLQLDELKRIVRHHRLDPTRNSDKWKTKERFVQLILERVPARSKQGDVFRHYGEAASLQSKKSQEFDVGSPQLREVR